MCVYLIKGFGNKIIKFIFENVISLVFFLLFIYSEGIYIML